MYCCRNQMTSKRKIQKIEMKHSFLEMKPGIFLICCLLRGLLVVSYFFLVYSKGKFFGINFIENILFCYLFIMRQCFLENSSLEIGNIG